ILKNKGLYAQQKKADKRNKASLHYYCSPLFLTRQIPIHSRPSIKRTTATFGAGLFDVQTAK
ncbi:MAG TPA: hypothetical protein DIS73_09040, partial [Planctomycetia bacterium]|nr:hypothetical protein [Planctomycetia bacterium]